MPIPSNCLSTVSLQRVLIDNQNHIILHPLIIGCKNLCSEICYLGIVDSNWTLFLVHPHGARNWLTITITWCMMSKDNALFQQIHRRFLFAFPSGLLLPGTCTCTRYTRTIAAAWALNTFTVHYKHDILLYLRYLYSSTSIGKRHCCDPCPKLTIHTLTS